MCNHPETRRAKNVVMLPAHTTVRIVSIGLVQAKRFEGVCVHGGFIAPQLFRGM